MEIIKYDVTDAAIEELGKRYLGLTITSLDNKEEFEAVHEARMVVKGKRVEVEKARKEYKAEALEYGRKVDTEAKRVFALLEPIETHLQTEEDKVINEKKRIEAEEKEKFMDMVNGRVESLLKYKVMFPFDEIAGMTDEEFDAKLAMAKEAYEAEEARKAEEEAERIARQAELDRQAELQAERDGEQAAERMALEAERRKLDDDKRKVQEAKDRAEFEAKAKEDARIQAEKEAKERIERERREAEREAEEKAALEQLNADIAARKAALLPDKEKLFAWAEAVEKAVPMVLDLNSKEAKGIFIDAVEVIEDIVEQVKKKARDM